MVGGRVASTGAGGGASVGADGADCGGLRVWGRCAGAMGVALEGVAVLEGVVGGRLSVVGAFVVATVMGLEGW